MPQRLGPAQASARSRSNRIPRWSSIFELTAGIAFLVWWASTVTFRTEFAFRNVRITLTPAWRYFLCGILFVSLVNVALAGGNLVAAVLDSVPRRRPPGDRRHRFRPVLRVAQGRHRRGHRGPECSAGESRRRREFAQRRAGQSVSGRRFFRRCRPCFRYLAASPMQPVIAKRAGDDKFY